MKTLAEELMALQERLEQLEAAPCSVADWHRFEARVARALINFHCTCEAQLAELRVLRLCAQVHIDEYAA